MLYTAFSESDKSDSVCNFAFSTQSIAALRLAQARYGLRHNPKHGYILLYPPDRCQSNRYTNCKISTRIAKPNRNTNPAA